MPIPQLTGGLSMNLRLRSALALAAGFTLEERTLFPVAGLQAVAL